MNPIETFCWGLFGGLGAELAVLFGIRQQFPEKFPHWVRSGVYWLIALGMAVAGGVIALAYVRSGTQMSAVLAIQVGASAPLFLRKARDVIPDVPTAPDPVRVD